MTTHLFVDLVDSLDHWTCSTSSLISLNGVLFIRTGVQSLETTEKYNLKVYGTIAKSGISLKYNKETRKISDGWSGGKGGRFLDSTSKSCLEEHKSLFSVLTELLFPIFGIDT